MQKNQPISAIIREVVTAVLALLIVVFTLVLLASNLGSPSEENLDFAQGIFSILGGSVGVVLGYYFGRVPAERRAEKAEDQVATAQDTATQEQIARRNSDVAVSAFEDRMASLVSRYEAKLKRQQAQMDAVTLRLNRLLEAQIEEEE